VGESTGDPLEQAARHATLGLPVPRDARFRFLKRLVARFQRLTTHHQLAYNQGVIDALQILRTQITVLNASISDVRDVNATQLASHSVSVRSEIATLATQLAAHEATAGTTAARLDGAVRSLGELPGTFRELLDRLAALETKQEASRQRERAARAVDRLRAGSERAAPTGFDREPAALPDDLVFAIEDTFRGTFDDIQQRLRQHLEPVRAASAVGPALDLGCGRGEWLTILREAGLEGYGVDCNAFAVEHCRARHLEVAEGDVLDHLEKCGDESLGAITAFHIVEHLPIESLLILLSHAVRVLRPGGVLVIETPNVANVTVGASTFHLDPTHVTALHPLLLEFLVRAHGFGDVDVRFLNPAAPVAIPPAASPELAHALATFNGLLFSAQDVALAGWRNRD
jgi:O-antigen chain-terminating methyltransferase